MLKKRIVATLLIAVMVFTLIPMASVFAASSITWDVISNDQIMTNVTDNLNLIKKLDDGTDVVWSSSKTKVVNTDGIVNRLKNDENVTLTAQYGTTTKTFDIVVSSYKSGITKWTDNNLPLTLGYQSVKWAQASSDSGQKYRDASSMIWKYDREKDRLYTETNYGCWGYNYGLKIDGVEYKWAESTTAANIAAVQADTRLKNVPFTYGSTDYVFYYVDKAFENAEGKPYRVGVVVANTRLIGWTSLYVNIDAETNALTVDTTLPLTLALEGYLKQNLEPTIVDISKTNNQKYRTHLNFVSNTGYPYGDLKGVIDGYERFSFRFRQVIKHPELGGTLRSEPYFTFFYNNKHIGIAPSGGAGSIANNNRYYGGQLTAYYTTDFTSTFNVANVDYMTQSSCAMVGAKGSTLEIKKSANGLSNFPTFSSTGAYDWHEVIMETDRENGYTVMYFDGLPVYWKGTVSGTNYYSPFLKHIGYTSTSADPVRTGFSGPYTEKLFVDYEVENVKLEEISPDEITHLEFEKEVGSGVDIGDLDGLTKYFDQNFDSVDITEDVRISTDLGFSAVADTAAKANVNYYIKYNEIGREAETGNKVVMGVPKINMSRADAQLYNELRNSTTTVKWNSNTYKVKDFAEGYYIGALCTSSTNPLYWFKKSSLQNGVLPSTAVMDTDYGRWFNIDENYKPYNVATAGGSGFSIPAPDDDAVRFAIQFDFAYPSNGNIWTEQEGFQLYLEKNQFHFRSSGLFRSGAGAGSKLLCFGDGETSTEDTSKKVIMVPAKTLDLPYYFDAETYDKNLVELSALYKDGEWNKIMVYYDFIESYFTFYVNGMPLYAKAKNGGYSCRWKLDAETPEDLQIVTDRYLVFGDHPPVFDNFLAYSAVGTDEDIAKGYINGLRMPYIKPFEVITGDILFDKREMDGITWKFDKDTLVFDPDNPLIARYNAPYGFGTSKVKLTATYKYGTATATREFDLTVKDRAPFSIGSVVMEDAKGNRIYRPLDGATIESVVASVNTNDASKLYLGLYDSQDRLVDAGIGTLVNGKFVFNKNISANTKYKVFALKNGTIEPLAVAKTEDFPENASPKIYILGDSIAATYTTDRPYGGWGQYLGSIFSSNVKIDNSRSLGSRSMKYVLDENSFGYVMDNAKSGDYLFIMLGCNDQGGSAEWHRATKEEYIMLLRAMILEAKSKGVIPVVLTTIARYSWANQTQDATTGLYHPNDTYGEAGYFAASLELADEVGVPAIDMHAITFEELERLGPDATEGYYADHTHTNHVGAKWVVSLMKDALKKINLPLSDYIVD